MIPYDFITEWRSQAPWVSDLQVEQDLVISRALVEIFSRPVIMEGLAFRGGTALYKLHLRPPARYSEDIDLVQVAAGPIGPVLQEVRSALDPWLGEPRWKRGEGRVTLVYRYDSEGPPAVRMKLKVEINTREHFAVFGRLSQRLEVASRWFSGSADIPGFDLDELLTTKLRALYQRKKGRDLFDLALALRSAPVDPRRVVEAFSRYMSHEDVRVTRAEFERNLAQKRRDPIFTSDMTPLLASGHTWDPGSAFESVYDRLVALLPGEPWKGRAKEQ